MVGRASLPHSPALAASPHSRGILKVEGPSRRVLAICYGPGRVRPASGRYFRDAPAAAIRSIPQGGRSRFRRRFAGGGGGVEYHERTREEQDRHREQAVISGDRLGQQNDGRFSQAPARELFRIAQATKTCFEDHEGGFR